MNVYTVNYPLAYFAERIGGKHVLVVFPVPPDIDSAFWTPDKNTIAKYQRADLTLLNGANYAKWIQKISLPMMRTVDTSKSLKNEFIAIETNVTHSHGPAGDHSHSGTAFTTWLDFSFADRQAQEIFKALSKKMPDQKAELKSNYDALKADLLQLDEQMQNISKMKPDEPILASHPIYQYMARRYRLNLEMVMWEPDIYPNEGAWSALATLQEKHAAKWMIWEDTPIPASVDRLEDMEITSLVFSPCFNKPERGDFLTVMEQNIENLQDTFGQ